MSQYATTTHAEPNPIADVRIYWRVSGIALAAVAVLGIVLSLATGGAFISGFLEFDWTHNIVHVALAAVALGLGFGNVDRAVSKNIAKVIGVVYLGLGVVGFIGPVVEMLESLLGLGLEVGENLVHLLIGAWGAYAGFTE